MIKMKFRNLEKINISYYAIEEMKVGDIVGLASLKANCVRKIGKVKIKQKIPIGIAKQDVIKLDQYNPILTPSVGAKIEILTKGEIVTRMDKKLRLPINQPMYVDLNRSCLTWKAIGPGVGYTTSFQDQDGFIAVHIDFNGIN